MKKEAPFIMKKYFVFIVVMALMASGLYGCKKQDATATKAADETYASPVERGTLKVSVAATGAVSSNLDVDIKCKSSGEVTTVTCEVSKYVKKGDLLVALDPVDMQRNLNKAKVTLESSRAELEQAKLTLESSVKTLENDRQRAHASLLSAQATAANAQGKAERMKALLEKGRVSKEDYDAVHATDLESQAAVQTAEASVGDLKVQEKTIELNKQKVIAAEKSVETNKISLSIAEKALTDTQVFAPLSGYISACTVQVGQIIASATGNVSGGTSLLTISDLSHIFTLATVDESDIGQVKLGQDVNVTADSFPGVTFKGKVMRIATEGVNSSNVVTFEVKIEIIGENKDLLKPIMTTNVEILSLLKEDVLVVPTNAVTRKNGKSYVNMVVPEGQAAQEREVTVGASSNSQTEIISGLKEGEKILVKKKEDSKWSAKKRMGGMPPPM
jgi:HlyD family secretion protein